MTDPKSIDSYKTIKFNNSTSTKRISLKTLQYKKRLLYGRLESVGFLNSELRLQPYLTNNVEIIYSRPEQDFIDDNILNKLNYCADLCLNLQESKRETKLKKMLIDKLIKLSQMKKC
jgi:hypothetical protein